MRFEVEDRSHCEREAEWSFCPQALALRELWGKCRGKCRFFSSAVKTVLICPQLSHLISSLIVPCPVPSIGWARGLFWVPPALLSLPALVTPTAIAPHWLAFPHTWEHFRVGAASEAPSCPTPSPGPTSIRAHRARHMEGRPHAPSQWCGVFQLVMELTLSFTLRGFSFPFDPLQFMKNGTHVFLINFYKITEMLTF